ncbi:MAG: alpha/beta fold hydrolase [Alphaproteobacteria bacterium GM202ARS2]|nr:alpha/beta fold hydrolase [Alphaproteobacteria bacterium GM202ARS2]
MKTILRRRRAQTPKSYPLGPTRTSTLAVDGEHRLHIQAYGNPTGAPVLFLHGGPGSGCHDGHKRLFDARRWHVLFMDQRGSGRSQYQDLYRNNTTQHLIHDIETLRQHHGIDKWTLVGGSWGATLALAYAIAYPQHVRGLVLRSLFLASKADTRWAFYSAAQRFRPDLWDDLRGTLDRRDDSDDPIATLQGMLKSPQAETRERAAHIWARYEHVLSSLDVAPPYFPTQNTSKKCPRTPFLESHYMAHDFFLPPNHIIDNVARLRCLDALFISGRYDLLCPPEPIYRLQQAWGEKCTLRFVETAAHQAEAPAMRAALTRAIDDAYCWGTDVPE